MPAGELTQVRAERVPAGPRRFVSGLGGPSFKEAAVTGANATGDTWNIESWYRKAL